MNNTDTTEFITQMLEYLDPAILSYEEWYKIGMSLKQEGFSVNVWDEWSKRDAKRYHSGECISKWSTFNGNAKPVTGGTIYDIASSYGFKPAESQGYALDWNSTIGAHEKSDDLVVVNRNWLEGKEIKEPENWNPKEEIIRYLSIFDSTENVGYVTEVWEKDGKFMPTSGSYDRTAGQLIQELSKVTDICDVFGDYNKAAGAWIRFNPLDGKGVKNDNVTDFRYALVESDNMELEEQHAIIRELELPVAMLVYSGGKSIHAIVKIDAGSYDEYRKRVDYLYRICQKNGLKVDAQNRNPSRLSRMPGFERGGKKQFIIDSNIGKGSFTEWQEWIESVNDDLPDPESLCDVWDNMPELSPCLIDGVLRQGHKMLIAGPSKAGKSFALIELSISIAEGFDWFGKACAKGRVLYINLELDRASCLHRFRDVYTALHKEPRNISNIDIWNLRGSTIPMDKLAPKLIRRAHKKDYIAVIIDPIYKVITGDENSAEQMSYFCNQFDKICTELGTAVIYCHHHSKGLQGSKKSVDRASGSGVFARDPDALIDLTELELTDSIRESENNRIVEEAAVNWLNKYSPGWEDKILRDDLYSEKKAFEACRSLFSPELCADMAAYVKKLKAKAAARTAWRIESTLREFPKFEPINVWFDYPLHVIDETGKLGDIDPGAEPWQKAIKARAPKEMKKEKRNNKFEIAYSSLELSGEPITVEAMANEMEMTKQTIWNYLKNNDGFTTQSNGKKATLIIRKEQK